MVRHKILIIYTNCLTCENLIRHRITEKRSFCNKGCCDKYRTGKKRPNHSIAMIIKHKEKSFGYKKGENLGESNPAKRPEVRRKISEEAKGENNYFFKHHFNGPENWNWQGGKSFEAYGFDFTEELRVLIRNRDNNQCQICKKFGKDVHHIDYNKRNNDPKNLITLCKMHHGQTEHHRKKWIKFFQGGINGKQ